MTGSSKYPFNLVTLMMNGLLGKDIDQGLNNLKTVLER